MTTYGRAILIQVFAFLAAFPACADGVRKPNRSIEWPEDIKLHLVALVDDADAQLGAPAVASFQKVSKLVDEIGEALDLPVEVARFGPDVAFPDLLGQVRDTEYSRDIVFVFYFGHGARISGEPSRFYDLPILQSFGSGDPIDIIEAVLDDDPHFAIFLLDACNTPFDRAPVEIDDFLIPRNFGLEHADIDYRYLYSSPKTVSGYSTLFAESYGFIALASAFPGQRAYYDPAIGGLMTHTFVTSVERELIKYTPRWDRVFPDFANLRINLGEEELQYPIGSVCYVGSSGEIRCNQGYTKEAEEWAAERGTHPVEIWADYTTLDALDRGRFDLGQTYFDSVVNAGVSYDDEAIGVALRFIGQNQYTGHAPLYGVELLEAISLTSPKAGGIAGEALLSLLDWGTTGEDPLALLSRAFWNFERAAAGGDVQALFNLLEMAYFELAVPKELLSKYEAKYSELETELAPQYLEWRDEICADGDFGICR